MAEVNFYPPAIQQQYERDPRRELALALMQQNQGQPVRTPIQGWSQVLQGILGKYQQDRLQKEYGGRADEYRGQQAELAKLLVGSDPQMAALVEQMGGSQAGADFVMPVAVDAFKSGREHKNRLAEIEARKAAGADKPSNIAEWEAFNQMPPAQQEQYLRMKRADKTLDLGGSQLLLNNLTGQPSREYQKTLPPQNQPANVEAESAASERGKSAGDISSKAPVLDSLDYTANRLRTALTKVDTGGFLGYKGRISKALDYQDAAAVENLKQQLSTDLRALFRIPGEGTLSDKEQQLYGVQLPDVRFDAEKNEAIIQDIQNRARLRLKQAPDAAPPSDAGVGALTPEEEAERQRLKAKYGR